MNRVQKDYLPQIEPMPLDYNSKDYRRKWDKQLLMGEVEILTFLKFFKEFMIF